MHRLCEERAARQEEEGRANLPDVDCHVNIPQWNEDPLEEQEDLQIVEEEVVVEVALEQQPAMDEVNQEDVPGLIEEEDSDDDEVQEEDVEQQRLVENEMHEEQQECIIIEALNLPVVATGLANHRPKQHGEGLVKSNEKKQFTQEARAVACLYATYTMGWR